MSTVVTIGGSAVSAPGTIIPKTLKAYGKGAIPTFEFETRGGPSPTLPYPYLGQTCTVAVGGTVVFSGDVTAAHVEYRDGQGWVVAYVALGLRNRGDWFPVTDDDAGLDSCAFNLQPDDPSYFASRAGRTVGQVLTMVLEMVNNGGWMTLYGLGNLSGSGPYTLPSATVTDLAALTVIPPAPVYLAGEKFLGGIEAFLATWAPNHVLWIDPADGTFRFLDTRVFPASTLTLGTDPIEPTPLSRDTADCFQRVIVRGQPVVIPVYADTANNGLLAEDFAWGAYTSAEAKAAWTDADFQSTQAAQDQGTCTCPSTTTVTVTSSNPATFWASDYWDQTSTGKHGWLHVWYTTGGGTITQFYSASVVSNTALTAGGTSTLTIAGSLPVTSYTGYQLFGLSGNASNVYRLYSITNAAVAAALANQFESPVPFVLASGDAATLTSVPIGSVQWTDPGTSYTYEAPLDFTIDPVAGTILFSKPTWEMGNCPPTNVRALLAVNLGPNSVVQPANTGTPTPTTPAYQGTSHTVDGLSRTLTITVDQWRDPVNATAMLAYALDQLNSVQDAVIEGTVIYRGLYAPALTMGVALNIAGNGYTTGWEGPLTSFSGYGGVPVLECELGWNSGAGNSYTTVMHCSNRRAALSAAAFLKPDRRGQPLITFDGPTGFGSKESGHDHDQGGGEEGQSPEAAESGAFEGDEGEGFGMGEDGGDDTPKRRPRLTPAEKKRQRDSRRFAKQAIPGTAVAGPERAWTHAGVGDAETGMASAPVDGEMPGGGEGDDS